jgi:hypothetical protein
MGTVQLTAVPVQLAYAVNVVPSIFRIATVYPVITEPPSESGATQLMMTLVPETTVVGAAGLLGIVYGSTAPFPGAE